MCCLVQCAISYECAPQTDCLVAISFNFNIFVMFFWFYMFLPSVCVRCLRFIVCVGQSHGCLVRTLIQLVLMIHFEISLHVCGFNRIVHCTYVYQAVILGPTDDAVYNSKLLYINAFMVHLYCSLACNTGCYCRTVFKWLVFVLFSFLYADFVRTNFIFILFSGKKIILQECKQRILKKDLIYVFKSIVHL